ncbi:MAG: M67 family metallopeptidase [Herpetosiphon sp.]
MTLQITATVLQEIRAEGSKQYPHECCGLLLGTSNGEEKRAVETWPVDNVWTDDIALTQSEGDHSLRDRFYIPPKAYLQADRAARSRQLDVVGCYHSHPDDRAALSERDRVGAAGVGGGSGFSFVVISIRDSIAGDITSALLSHDGQEWLPEVLVIEE